MGLVGYAPILAGAFFGFLATKTVFRNVNPLLGAAIGALVLRQLYSAGWAAYAPRATIEPRLGGYTGDGFRAPVYNANADQPYATVPAAVKTNEQILVVSL